MSKQMKHSKVTPVSVSTGADNFVMSLLNILHVCYNNNRASCINQLKYSLKDNSS